VGVLDGKVAVVTGAVVADGGASVKCDRRLEGQRRHVVDRLDRVEPQLPPHIRSREIPGCAICVCE
jgi:hypothetical protein